MNSQLVCNAGCRKRDQCERNSSERNETAIPTYMYIPANDRVSTAHLVSNEVKRGEKVLSDISLEASRFYEKLTSNGSRVSMSRNFENKVPCS